MSSRNESGTPKGRYAVFAALLPALLLLVFCSWSFAQSTSKDRSPYTLENDQLKIRLRSDKPIIDQYVLKENGGLLLGNVRQTGPGISFTEGADHVVSNWTNVSYRSERSGNTITYHARATYGGREAVAFDLRCVWWK